jgi:dihydroorotate dehydrogenase
VSYRLLFGLVLSRIDPERAHRLAAALLGALPAGPLRRLFGARDPALRVHALGRTFPSPLGVAAGVDKDATWFEGLGALGFGFVEIGTVTAQAQPGNARPRIERFVQARALLNWMGFPNAGAAAVAPRVARPRTTIVGVNVGKSKVAPVAEAAADYRTSVRLLAAHADYLALNVSSPNTPGLRSLQAAEALDELVAGVQDELAALGLRVPLLVKIAPDLADEEIDAVADLAVRRGLDGIIATNTTTDRGPLVSRLRAPGEPAGVSGAPLSGRSLEVLRRLRARVGERLVLVSAGGIGDAEDAWQRLQAGATLLQAYTGFVYGGPLWAWRVNRALARRLTGGHAHQGSLQQGERA